MVRPESSTKHQTPKQKQEALRQAKMIKRKKEESLRKGVLQPKTIERLKQVLLIYEWEGKLTRYAYLEYTMHEFESQYS